MILHITDATNVMKKKVTGVVQLHQSALEQVRRAVAMYLSNSDPPS